MGRADLVRRRFIQAAAGADQYEILAARIAVIESRDPHVIAFAHEMLQDHSESSEQLRQAALRSGLAPGPVEGIGPEQAALLAALQGARGSDFDKLYANQQLLAHQAALTVLQTYASRGQDANLRRAALAIEPMVQRHLEKAKQLRNSL